MGNACLPIVEFMALFWHDSNCCSSVHIPHIFLVHFRLRENKLNQRTNYERMCMEEFGKNVIIFRDFPLLVLEKRTVKVVLALTFSEWVMSRDSKLFVENVVEVDKHRKMKNVSVVLWDYIASESFDFIVHKGRRRSHIFRLYECVLVSAYRVWVGCKSFCF